MFKIIRGDNIKSEKDLKKYSIRTDLAIDEVKDKKIDGVRSKSRIKDTITITKVYLNEQNILGKKAGTYVTLEFDDCTDKKNKEKLIKVLTLELKKLIDIKLDDLVLIIGLGNKDCTPDSLGPLTVKNIKITNHIYMLDNLSQDYNRVSTFTPGVMGTTGLETSDIIKGIVDKVKPKLVIVIDSLASSSTSRLNKTIQLTDTGIHPGSGVENKRKEISKETLGIPVIAIGVPTVVDATIIVADTIAYIKNINTDLLGLLGTLKEEEIKELIYEILEPINSNLMVSPKEIDYIIKELSSVIATSINFTFHNRKSKK